ncbi:hypothetical protein GCM10010317_083280 [Streptomyces mirabilis]|nr:hypothetical protein GCM10010317_083280 [Streptomyces mirabilis]
MRGCLNPNPPVDLLRRKIAGASPGIRSSYEGDTGPRRILERVRQVLEQLAELSPVVQALPPSAALVEMKGESFS